jgi:hypothetical protein
MNYNNKKFILKSNTVNGSTTSSTIFHYFQENDIVTSNYAGGKIIQGHLIGLVDDKGVINMSYHQVELGGVIKTGKCVSTPELLPDGRIRLYESWEWTCEDFSKGKSIIEEMW